jgi:GDP-mannose 6-dehydrogenase
LPKDVRALQHIAGDVGVGASLIESLLRSNEAHKHFIYHHCTRDLEMGASVLVCGLAFKANSDDLRESPHVDLVGKLVKSGYRVRVFDPDVAPSRMMGQNLGYAYVHLPDISQLLVDKAEAEETAFDLIIDTNGCGRTLNHPNTRRIDVNYLEDTSESKVNTGLSYGL